METTPMEGIEQFYGEKRKTFNKLSELVEGEVIIISSSSSGCPEHSRHDSDNDIVKSTSPSSSPVSKRPCLLRRLDEFNTPEELEQLKSVAGKVAELKDYAKWFNSLGAEVDKDAILWPSFYCQWFSTLGFTPKVNGILQPLFVNGILQPLADGVELDGILGPSQYFEWYASKFYKPQEFPDVANYAKLALAHLKKTDECEDYEYVRDEGIVYCPDSIHMNFYARRRVSDSTLEPAPEKLFFAELDTEDNVMECTVLPYEEFNPNGSDEVLHPPDIDCKYCNGFVYYHCCPDE